MSCTELHISDRLSDFLTFYDEAIKMYNYCFEMVNECDKLKCDLLHKIELSLFTDRNEENRVKTQLKQCLKDRRYYKDRVEELEPFVKLFIYIGEKSSDNSSMIACTKAINLLKTSLGTIRKMEDYHKNRTYKPRILKDLYGG